MATGQHGASDASELFADSSKRWLLIAGAGLSASSGVPQSARRTRWSPSLADVVTYQLFRTQNRQVFESLEHDVSTSPPLGFVGDSLDKQASWLDDYLTGHKPHTPLIRAADLAKAGVFHAVATNAPDRLLNDAFDSVGVSYKQVSLEDPHLESAGPLPLLREWDARVFKDTEDRRSRESTFVRGQLDELLQNTDGVLVVGHSPETSDLMRAVTHAASSHAGMHVVWVDDEFGASATIAEDESVTDWFEQHHPGFVHIRTNDLGAFLDMIAVARKVEKTPVTHASPPAPLLRRTMNKSFDVRPALVFVPGVALLGGLVDRLPRISVKMIISIFALLVSLVAYINWDIWTEYRDQINPVKVHLANAKRLLEQSNSYEGAIRAEAQLNDAARKAERVVLPYDSVFSISLVHRDIDRDYESTNIDIRSVRDLQVTPMLYRNRFANIVGSDPSRLSLENHPPLLVLPGLGQQSKDPRGLRFRGKELSSYQLPRQLSRYGEHQRLALFSASAPLLRVTMQESMLRALRAGRLAVEIDLSHAPNLPLEDQIYASVKRVAGYVGKRAALFSPDGITELLDKGMGTFYFFHVEASGTARSLDRIRELLVRFPNSRAVIAAYSTKARERIARTAPEFELVTLTNFSQGRALRYLRKHTSAEFVRRLMQNHYLRTNIGDPLVLSLLVDFFKFSGVVPRSLALVYDRLLQSMLSRGKHTYASKFPVLRALAWEIAQTNNNLTRERATSVIAATLFRKGNHDGAAVVLDELVANGVLRYRADTFVDFMDEGFYVVSLAKQLPLVGAAERKRMLHADSGRLVASYAGLNPNVDELIGELTRGFYAVDTLLRAQKLHLERVNPYVFSLTTAVLLASNGHPGPGVVSKLEQTLFELVKHKVPEVVHSAFQAIRALSSPGIRRWVLVGLSDSKPYDEKLLQYTASAPETTYTAAIDRWLVRVGTAADPRQKQRYAWDPYRGSPTSAWERKRGALTSGTAAAIRYGLHALAQLGSPQSLSIVDRFAAQANGSKRFGKKLWDGFRRSAVSYLLDANHDDRVRRFYTEIKADPAAWAKVIPQLHRLNDKATAQLLVDIIAKPDKFGRQTPKYKALAAMTLALMDSAASASQLRRFLTAPPANPSADYRPYAAASLAYRGDASDFSRVRTLVDAARKQPLKDRRAHRFAQNFVAQLGHAVAAFGDKQALATFTELYADPNWRKRGANLDRQWRYFRSVGGAKGAFAQLMCHDVKPRGETTLMDQLGFMRNDQAHEYLLKVIRMVEGDDDPKLLRTVCGSQLSTAVARIARWRKDGLGHLVAALAADPRPKDLSLYAKWAMHPTRSVRRAAYYALRGYSEAAAGKAIADSLASYELDAKERKTLARTGVHLMGEQGSMGNEQALLAWLKREHAPKSSIVIALGKCGGVGSLLALLKATPQTRYRGNLSRAIYLIATRTRGGGLANAKVTPADALLTAILQRIGTAKLPPQP